MTINRGESNFDLSEVVLEQLRSYVCLDRIEIEPGHVSSHAELLSGSFAGAEVLAPSHQATFQLGGLSAMRR
jgi:hypothetical protein